MDRLPHLVFLASPGMGHFIPSLELAKKFVLHHHFSATILVFPELGPKWTAVQTPYLQPDQLPANINCLHLPLPDFSDLPLDMKHDILGTYAVGRSLPSIRHSLSNLLSQKLRIVALVVDLLGTPAIDIAREFNISPYLFFTTTAMCLSLFLHVPKLDQRVSCEYRELDYPIRLPGCVPIPSNYFPDGMQNRQGIRYKGFLQIMNRYPTVDGIIVNTFQELEPGAFKGLQEDDEDFYGNNPLIYTIGPLIQSNLGMNHDAKKESILTNWLDKQPKMSVLYICFGSHWMLTEAQMNELALGLEISETRFLWVVRTPKDDNGGRGDDPLDFLPKGFIERTKERGLMVPYWASQQTILEHEAIGGFVTHCGWNSTLEGIVNGVPMIAWPQGAEQKMNSLILTEDVKIAIKVTDKGDDHELVVRSEIADIVKSLMEGEEGKMLRGRVRELKYTAKKALLEEGSSWNSFADLTSKWKTM